MADGYPVVIPDVIVERLQRYIKPEAVNTVINRPADVWGGKSAIQAVADGDLTWEQVLWEYERLFSYGSTQ